MENERLVQLIQTARQARQQAFAPYSNFRVGAALATANGDIITGCNVESASFGLTLCAERVAVFKAVSEGHRDFSEMVVVADTDTLTPPCGACRQILWEFCPKLQIHLANLGTGRALYQIADLLPAPFDANLLQK